MRSTDLIQRFGGRPSCNDRLNPIGKENLFEGTVPKPDDRSRDASACCRMSDRHFQVGPNPLSGRQHRLYCFKQLFRPVILRQMAALQPNDV